MKKCRRCTKPATLHITEIKQGQVRALHLCESCAQDYLANVDSAKSDEEELEGAEGSEEGAESQLETICPKCGIRFKKFRSQGRLGCAHDYELFRDRLEPLLESIHGERQHIGKCPRQRPDASRRQHDLARLRSELKAAVDAEDYERAAQIRDAIRQHETE